MSTELLPNIRSKFTDANGDPLAGGKLYSYEAGTTTPLATYTDQAGASPNTNPIILDANGEAVIFITSGVQYKFILTDADDVQQWAQDDVSGVGFSGNLGTGDVVGPAASVNNEIALFSGTTGKVVKRAGGTGFVKSTAGVVSYVLTIDLSTEVTGTLPTNKGGTGAATANEALNNLLPDQTGNAGKYFQTDGVNGSWVSAPSGAPTITGSRASPQDITAAGGIAFAGSAYDNVWFVQGDGGAITVTANPQIAAGSFVGQRLTLIQRSATNTLTFSDGNGLDLLGGSLVLDVANQQARFFWDGTNWVLTP